MKGAFLASILLFAALCFAQAPASDQKPLGKNQIMALLKAGMESEVLAKTVQERGIDFEPSDDDLAALRKAGAQDVLIKALRTTKPRPLTREQVLQLVVAGVASQRAATLVKQRGIDFVPGEEDLSTLRVAGADEALVAALRAAGAAVTAEITVVTSTNAEVYLDGALLGRASVQGELNLKSKPGLHTVKVSLTGKKDHQREVTFVAGKANRVEARLEDLPGSIRVQTAAGAEVFLDNSSLGTTGQSGQLVIPDVKVGDHDLRVSAPGKKEYRESVKVVAGKENRIEARLEAIAGSLRVRTSVGASVMLDDSIRGSADAGGELLLSDVSPGVHEVRVSAPRKKDYRQTVTVLAGQEARIKAALEDAPPSPGEVIENPKDGLKYAWIPPGTFTMGCSPGDSECSGDEKPAHQVTLSKGFWMGQTEVTVAAYKRYATATATAMPSAPKSNSGWANEQMPIVNVSWNDADGYCRWAGGRLPTEAEWEYAARAGSTEVRYGPVDDIAWYHKNSGGKTHEVGQKRANAFNLFDMLGNVWEWVSDGYGEKYYEGSPGHDPQGPGSGEKRVLRGGSWDDFPRSLRASYRVRYRPGNRFINFGFRCGREVDLL